MQIFVKPEDVDAKLAYKIDNSSEEVRVDVELVIGKWRVVGAVVLQQKGHTCNGPRAPPKSVFRAQSCLGKSPKTK